MRYRTGARPDDQLGGQHDPGRREVGRGVEGIGEQPGGRGARVGARHPDGGEGGGDVRGDPDVVDAEELISTPTCTPRSVSRRTTPSAIWSLNATTAVDPSAMTRSAARTPDSKPGEKGPTTASSTPARAQDASMFRRRSRLVNIVVGAASR
jgi:hypothetical protein